MSEAQQSSSQPNTREIQRTRDIVDQLVQQRLSSITENIDSTYTNMDIMNKPPVFCSGSMDANLWLLQYKDFVKSRKLSDEQFVASFAANLNQNAQKWFYNLTEQEKRDPTTLGESFLTRFQLSQSCKQSAFFSRQQNEGEPVEDYIDDKVHLANQASIAEDTAVWHTINHMLPHTKQYVFERVKDQTFKSVREHARMSTSVLPVAAPNICTMCSSKQQDGTFEVRNQSHMIPHQQSGEPKQQFHHQSTSTTSKQSWQPLNLRHSNPQSHLPQFRNNKPCRSCGKTDHIRPNCHVFINQVRCHSCQKPGHLQRVCQAKTTAVRSNKY